MENNVTEFCDILRNLNDTELSVLHETLMLEDEKTQRIYMRETQADVNHNGNLYNAYCARVIVDNPIIYVKNEIIMRFYGSHK